MVTALRYTPQKQQELRSRHQLSERLTDFGWLPFVPEDLGEDFIVHIYHEGRATGVNFYVQLKSVTNLNERRKGNHLPYSFKVKDLVHWEQFGYPVVLIIWDVKLREGRWAVVNKIIQQLDQRFPNWRTQKTKTVFIPWENTSDHKGLIRLRQEIGRFLFPQISNNKSLEMQLSLSFPPDEEGTQVKQAFEKYLKEGDSVTLKGRIIQGIEFSDWFGRWFGEYDPNKVQLILGSTKSSHTFTYDLIMNNYQGNSASLTNIEFKVEKSGTELVQISNMHKKNNILGIRITYNIRNRRMEVAFSVIGKVNKPNVKTIQESLQFLQAVNAGGKLELVGKVKDNEFRHVKDLPPSSKKLFDPKYLQIIDHLCFIQEQTGKVLNITTDNLPIQDVNAANELFTILKRGKTEKKQQFVTGKFKGEALEILAELQEKGEPINIRMQTDESYVDLLNIKFPTGTIVQHIIDAKLDDKFHNLRSTISNQEENKFLDITLTDATVIEIFPDRFLHESERLCSILAEKFNITSVFLFGSLVWGDQITLQTDIDLAVSGLNYEQIFKAIGYLEQVTQFPFDLIDLDEAPPALRKRILTEGKLLYEREPVAVSG